MIVRRLKYWLTSARRHRALREEMAQHLEEFVAELQERGVDASTARAEAFRKFGNPTTAAEDARQIWIWRWLDVLLQDARYSVRLMVRQPFFAVTSAILVAVTIALASSTFSVLDAVALREIPAPNPEELVIVRGVAEQLQVPLTGAMVERLGSQPQYISQSFGFSGTILQTAVDDSVYSIPVHAVMGEYFETLGGRPQLGRFFIAGETDAVAVISDRFWQNNLGSDPEIIGKPLRLGLHEVTIIGVADPGFVAADPYINWALTLPMPVYLAVLDRPADAYRTMGVSFIARLRPGVAHPTYQSQINAMWDELVDLAIPPGFTRELWERRRGTSAVVDSGRHGHQNSAFVGNTPQVATVTFGLALLIFATSGINLALLAVARNIRNQHEAAIMGALGGTRWRVFSPFLIESIVISTAACLVGIMAAGPATQVAVSFLPSSPTVDWRVETYSAAAVGLAVLTAVAAVAILSAVAGFFSLREGELLPCLRNGDRVSRPRIGLRAALLTAQFALSLVLTHHAVVYVGTLRELERVDVGFNVEGLYTYWLTGTLPTRELDLSYFQELQPRLESLPGVESIAMLGGGPLITGTTLSSGRVRTPDEREAVALARCAFPGALETLGVPMLSGRSTAWEDEGTAVITEDLATRLFPDLPSPLGRIVETDVSEPLRVIGVSGSIAYAGQRNGPSPMLFMPCPDYEDPWPSNFIVTVLARSARELPDLGSDVRAEIDLAGVHYVSRMDRQADLLTNTVERERMLATVGGTFGGAMILLLGVGLYAFCSYLLALRTQELAIRGALGASPARIGRELLRETLVVLGVGLILGTGLTLASWRLINSLIPDFGAGAGSSLTAAVAIVLVISTLASLVPTLRGIRTDLSSALRA